MSSHWFQTYSGKIFSPKKPGPEQICIEDIAQSLSMICRFNGHISEFYSVAQHSVLVSRLVPEGFELEGLLHDATEAYVGDMPSPIKRMWSQREYVNLEEEIYRAAISNKFELPPKISPQVKKADLQALALEKEFLVTDYGYDWYLE
ncbi:MAG: HD family hydrolase, partial [Desulfobacterales bacterium]|nr:HD family hydrolase [Desulfobacterales bacterium]